jgi:sugar transferase (PEP-CTERM/EpsH1 system associated)
MIPYLSKVQKPARATVMDFVDVGSAKWRNFDTLGSFYERFMHRREAKILSSEEIKTAALTDLNLFVTDKETQLFNNLARQSGRNFRDFSTCTLENGVDYSYWSQGHSLPSPYTLPKSPVIIFTGAMDYKPNIQGVLNFVEKVFPQILQEVPSAQFVIAGSSPTPEILKLVEKKTPHITVTGYISDMRPWLAHACVSVAPLKVACGVQNKILEAMAAGTAVVSSPKAAQGLSFPGTSPFFVAGTSRAFAHAVSVLLKNKNIRDEIALQASRKVIRFYSWEKRQRQLISMIDHIL